MHRLIATLALACLVAAPASAQDARAVVAAASKAMGVDGLDAIHYYGSGATFTIGQNNNANMPWPRVNANDYVRAIDFRQPASRATWVTWAVPVTGGAATQGNGVQNITPAMTAWAQQLEIWVTPWGFLKGAAGLFTLMSDLDEIDLAKKIIGTLTTKMNSVEQRLGRLLQNLKPMMAQLPGLYRTMAETKKKLADARLRAGDAKATYKRLRDILEQGS